MPGLRSLLFVPGDQETKLAKVCRFGADVVIADLEDAVATNHKARARSIVADAITGFGDECAFVRINAVDTGLWQDDLHGVAKPGLDGIMVPKVESADQLWEVDRILERLETERGIPAGDLQLLGLVETAAGLVGVEATAVDAPPRLRTLCLGQGDLAAEVGLELTTDGRELDHVRTRLLLAVSAAGLEPPVDGPFFEIKDLEGLRENSRIARRLGFQGRIVVYPPQVAVVHEVFGVDAEALERARVIVATFEDAGSAAIQVDDTFVDYPVYRRALRTIQEAGSSGGGDTI